MFYVSRLLHQKARFELVLLGKTYVKKIPVDKSQIDERVFRQLDDNLTNLAWHKMAVN